MPGVSIVLCYTFQLTVFLPCLALNARRDPSTFRMLVRDWKLPASGTQANRVDCCCCFKVKEREFDDPQGCCVSCCLPPKVRHLESWDQHERDSRHMCCLRQGAPAEVYKGGLLKKGTSSDTLATAV